MVKLLVERDYSVSHTAQKLYEVLIRGCDHKIVQITFPNVCEYYIFIFLLCKVQNILSRAVPFKMVVDEGVKLNFSDYHSLKFLLGRFAKLNYIFLQRF